MREHSPGSGSGTQVLHYSMIATCVDGGYECVISEYAKYGYAGDSQDLWQACEAKGSAGMRAAGCVCPTRYSPYASRFASELANLCQTAP